MMRGPIVTGLGLVVLAWSMGGAALAQDEMIGVDPAGYVRVEIPEAGIALAFPPDWGVDIEMDRREDFELSEEFEDAAPVYFWKVLYASGGGRPWCDLTWYPDHPLSVAEHAVVYEERMLPSAGSGVERTVTSTSIELGAGEAYRFDTYNQPTDDHTVAFLFESDAAHFLLACVGDTFGEVDGLGVVETVEILVAEPGAEEVEVGADGGVTGTIGQTADRLDSDDE